MKKMYKYLSLLAFLLLNIELQAKTVGSIFPFTDLGYRFCEVAKNSVNFFVGQCENTVSVASSTPTICVNTALTTIRHTTTGATGIGTATGLPAGVTATWAADTIKINGTPTTVGTFMYSIPLTGGCGGNVNATGTITVASSPTVSAASSLPTACANNEMMPVIHTTTNATSLGTATGLPAGISAVWVANIIVICNTPTAAGTFNYSIPVTGICGSTTATGTITVNMDNTADPASSTPTLCIKSSLTTITHKTTGATGIGTATGLPAGVTATWASDTVKISGTPTESGTFEYTVPLTGGCGTINATGSITVTAANTVGAASATPSLCINTALTDITHTTTGATGIGMAMGLPAGVTASWASNTITISGTPTESGTFNYKIPLTGGCDTVKATGTITVNKNTAATASSRPTVCINAALTTITIKTTGATGIGAATGLPDGVTATWASDTIKISGTPTASGTFNYIIPLTGGCATVNASDTIKVTPLNTAAEGSSMPTPCINTAMTTITHVTTGATGIGTATGLPAGVTATWAADTIKIIGTPTDSGAFNYTIPLIGGCGSINATGTITVFTLNKADTASASPTLCINTALTTITIKTKGATGIGTATGLPAGVTAAWASDTIKITGTPTAAGTFNYTIPLTGGCGTVNATGSIKVTPDNTVGMASSRPTLCKDAALTTITIKTTGATGIGAATGLPDGVTAAWASDTIKITGTPTVSGIFSYSIPLTGGCGMVNASDTIKVNHNTAGAASSMPTPCINTAMTTITHVTTGATGIGTATGLPAGVTATWAADTIKIIGTPTDSGAFNYTIPLTGGCGNVNATGTITVVTLNKADTASASPTLCINTALTTITIKTKGATGIGTATGLPAGVTAAWASDTIKITGTPTAAGTFNYTIPLTGGCGTVNATGTIKVTPANTVGTASSTPTLCINASLTTITHTTTGATGIGTATDLPAGVTATWASDTIKITGSPTAAGIFNYSIPLTGGCGSINATGTITVNTNTVSEPSSTSLICTNTAMTAITHTTTGATGIGTPTGLPTGVTAAWASNTITISGTPVSAGTYMYSIPLTGGCGSVNAVGTITVIDFYPNPDINVTYANVLLNTGDVETNDLVPSGTTYGPATPNGMNPSGGILNLQSNGKYNFISSSPGLFVYQVPVTSPQGCTLSFGLSITVFPLFEGSGGQPYANTDVTATRQNKKVVIKTLANDAASGDGVMLVPNSVTIVTAPASTVGTAIPLNDGTGDIEFTPHPDFTGIVSYTYRVCDDRNPALCNTALQTVRVIPTDAPNTTVASDDFIKAKAGQTVTGSVIINDNDPEGHGLIVEPLDTSIFGVGRLDLRNNPYPSNKIYDPRATARMGIAANGTFTFYPVVGFAGPAHFVYRVCDNNIPKACTEATLYILVAPEDGLKTDCECRQNITVTLDSSCQYILRPRTVSPQCGSAIVRVMDTNPLNLDTIDCAGVWTYGLFNIEGKLICWGKITVEDKSGPELVQWNGRCNTNSNAGMAPAPGAPAIPPFLDPKVIRRDTFLCTDIDQVFNVSKSWLDTSHPFFSGRPVFQDGCHNRRNSGSFNNTGNPIICDCRTDVRINDQIVYFPCPLPTTSNSWTGVWAQITRVFTATDCMGNITTTTQTITFVRPPITTLAQQVAAAGGSFSSAIGDGAKTRVFLDAGILAPDPRLMLITDSTTCASDTDAELMRKLRTWYYIFDDQLKCDDNVRDDYAYFAEGASTDPRRPQLQCNYAFDSQILSSHPVCDGQGKKLVVQTNYFDWCTGVKLPLDTITIRDHDNLPPRYFNNAKEQVVISTGAMDCTASFGIDRASLLQFFGIDIQDNAGGCGIRDVSVKVQSCKDSVAHGIIIQDYQWRLNPSYQTVVQADGRRLVLGVPAGMHRLVISATDMCYQQKDTTVYFRVEDRIAPVVKCTEQLNVTLVNTMGGAYGQSNTQVGTGIYGYARVLANQINGGASDNCALDWVRVRRALPVDNELGLKSYYTSLRNDPRYIDADDSKSITKGDGYDWNGNGTVDFGLIEQFRDTILPLQSSTSSMSPAIMTPLLDWVDFFCSDYDKNVVIELWAKDVMRTITTCAGSSPATMTSGGNFNYCWMNVLIEDKVAPTFLRPWDVTANCLDRAWLDTLALALSARTLELNVNNLTGEITSRTAGTNHAALYNYIESQILSNTENNASISQYISGVSGKTNVANNKFTRVSGGDCGNMRLDVVIGRPNWHCDAGQYTLTFRPQKLVKDVWQYYDGPSNWLNTLLGGGNVTTITIEPVHNYTLRFPADHSDDCRNVRDTANVVDGGELGCDVLAVMVQDKRYNGATKDGVPVAECYKIFRTFTVVNWCQYDERCGEPMRYAVVVPRDPAGNGFTGVNVLVRDADRNKTEEITYQDASTTEAYPGDVVNKRNGANPNTGSSTSLSMTGQPTPCSVTGDPYKGRNVDGGERFAWMFTQYILVHDATPPTLASTEPNGGWVGYQNKETCGGEIKIAFSSTDACAATEIQDQASIAIERVWLNPGRNKNARVIVPNAQLTPVVPTLTGDSKTTQATQNWTFEVTNAASHGTISQSLVPGQHSLTVVVRDDCGNLSRELDIPFTILDTNGTAPLCINGLSTNLMYNPQTGKNEVTIWATDFKAPSEVWDCSGQGLLTDPAETNNPKHRKMVTNANYFVFVDEDPLLAGFQNAGIGSNEKPTAGTLGNLGARTSITLTCDKLQILASNPPSGARTVLVRVYTRDNAGQFVGNTDNWAWCETFVSVDNATVCGAGSNTSASIAGAIRVEDKVEVKVEGVEVNLSGKSAMMYKTDQKGQFSFEGLAKGYDYTITPLLDKDYLNGVSTFDLVQIAKHILGQIPITSPYKLIAADVNNSKSVSTLDLVQLRRLVLGLDAKLSSNTSWRFVDASFRFPDTGNPWKTVFPEVVSVNNLSDAVKADFVAIKVGDVNGSALGISTARTNGVFRLNAEDKSLKAGTEVRIPVKASLAGMEGYQFTLGIDRSVADLVDIEYGVMQSEHFGVFAKEGLITASWESRKAVGEGETLFTLVLRAKADVSSLSEVLNINSRITVAEAYTKGGEYQSVGLSFGDRTPQSGSPMLYQNIPNPFAGETMIGFNLPVSGEVVLTVSDVQGRVLRVMKGRYNAGYNAVVLRGDDLPAGVLQYTLTSGEFTATRRMVVGK